MSEHVRTDREKKRMPWMKSEWMSERVLLFNSKNGGSKPMLVRKEQQHYKPFCQSGKLYKHDQITNRIPTVYAFWVCKTLNFNTEYQHQLFRLNK